MSGRIQDNLNPLAQTRILTWSFTEQAKAIQHRQRVLFAIRDSGGRRPCRNPGGQDRQVKLRCQVDDLPPASGALQAEQDAATAKKGGKTTRFRDCSDNDIVSVSALVADRE